MKKEVNWGQLVSVAVGIMMAIFGAWLTLNGRVTKVETTVDAHAVDIRSIRTDMKADRDELRKDFKEMQNTLNDIKVMLERKQDRK